MYYILKNQKLLHCQNYIYNSPQEFYQIQQMQLHIFKYTEQTLQGNDIKGSGRDDKIQRSHSRDKKLAK
jgi:hypothetical protein